ncbi:MAG: hypothetical protein ABF649_22425, partial [Bacillus sp. (in: firmicutes)]
MRKLFRNHTICLWIILFSIGITCYFTITVIHYPLVGLEVKEENKRWVIEKVYNRGWASSQGIEEGSIIELVNGGQPNQHTTVKRYHRVEMANSITILEKNGQIKTYSISYRHFDAQYFIYLLFPFLFIVTVIALSIFLYRKKKEDASAIILIYFLLSVSISYLSASGSARGDILGRLLTTITLPSSFILFSHFIKQYLKRFDLVFLSNKTLITLYT